MDLTADFGRRCVESYVNLPCLNDKINPTDKKLLGTAMTQKAVRPNGPP